MLVLTRKPEEQIQIGEEITITILGMKGHAVRLGIEAPQGINILRTELLIRPTTPSASSTSAKRKLTVKRDRSSRGFQASSSPKESPRPVRVASLRPYLDLRLAEKS